MTTSEKAKELIKKAKGATPGPWVVDRSGDIIQTTFTNGDFHKIVVGLSDGIITGNNDNFIAACSPDVITEICERLIRYEEALERYQNTQLLIREGNAIVQVKNGNGEWINTVPLYTDETWVLGDIAREALKEVE